MSTDVDNGSMVCGIVQSINDERITLTIPHTDYQLDFVLDSPTDGATPEIGKRIEGTIVARALKVHPARGGGCFIEPVNGSPRIVAGMVRLVDESARRVLVDAVVPMWVDLLENQDISFCLVGELVNFYVESGAIFTPRSS